MLCWASTSFEICELRKLALKFDIAKTGGPCNNEFKAKEPAVAVDANYIYNAREHDFAAQSHIGGDADA